MCPPIFSSSYSNYLREIKNKYVMLVLSILPVFGITESFITFSSLWNQLYLTSLFQVLDKNLAHSYVIGVVVEHVSRTTCTGTGRQRLARV